MHRRRKLKRKFLYLRLDLKDSYLNTKRRVWNKTVLLWWYRLWIRNDEFQASLNMDIEEMIVMTKDELAECRYDIAQRRYSAHMKSL